MSSAPVSRTVSELAKQLKAYDCTDASHSVVVRAVDQAAAIATDRTTRAVLAVRYLEEWNYPVRRDQLNKLVLDFRTRQHRQGPEAEQRRHEKLLEAFRMPTEFAASDDPFSPRDHPDRPFSMFYWWPSGRSLGVYGADLDRRAAFVSHLLRSGTRSVVPVRQSSQADLRMLVPAADVVDLTETPGGIRQLLEGEEDVIVLVDPRHGLEESDLDVLAELALHPASSIRVVYTESFALRGWTTFMDAMLDYAESVLLGPAPAADLATFGLVEDYEVPEAPGAGLYMNDGGFTIQFGAPESFSVYRDAHQANEAWGPCGHRPAVAQGATPVPLLPGDTLWFWGTEVGTGWEVDTTADHHGVLTCTREDPDQPTLWGDPGTRRLIISTAHGLREEYPWVADPADAPETTPRGAEQLCEDVHRGRLRFTDDARRLDLRAVIRDGRIVWIDEQ